MNRKNQDTMDTRGFVLLSDYVPGIIQEIRYFSTYNFLGERVNGYEEPCAILYRFEVDGEENIYKLSNGTKDKDGNYDYPIRNKLKKGSRYIVAIEDGFITTVEEIKKRGITSISLEATDMGRPLYQRFGFVNMEYEMELPE